MQLPSETDLLAMGLAWARVLPTITIVPAFGLRALPTPARGVVSLALAASIYPALVPVAPGLTGDTWIVSAFTQVLLGLPVALAAAVPLWAATMAGGIADTLRGSSDNADLVVVDSKSSSFGVLLSLFASATFLATGGASRVAGALVAREIGQHPLLAAAQDLTGGIGLAVALAGPLLATAIVLELTFALVSRAASPAQIHALLAPLRALGLVAAFAIMLERVTTVLANHVSVNP